MTLDDIVVIANRLHGGQLDKSGRPYIGHCQRVAEKVGDSGGDWTQTMAAWLHDSIEDTHVTDHTLLLMGVPQVVVDIVVAMTHPKGQSNQDYWEQVRAHQPAVLVKLCDIYDNMDPARLSYLDRDTRVRLRRKYATAILNITA